MDTAFYAHSREDAERELKENFIEEVLNPREKNMLLVLVKKELHQSPRVLGAAFAQNLLDVHRLMVYYLVIDKHFRGLGLGTYFVNAIKELGEMKTADFVVAVVQNDSREFWSENNHFIAMTDLSIEEQFLWDWSSEGKNYSNSERLLFPLKKSGP